MQKILFGLFLVSALLQCLQLQLNKPTSSLSAPAVQASACCYSP